jgi:hypothetical protein
MHLLRQLIVSAAALAALTEGRAQAAENLDCIDTEYSAPQQVVLADFIAVFSMERWAKGPPGEVVAILQDSAKRCAVRHGWSLRAAEYAFLFKFASLGLAGVEKRGPLTPTQIGQLQSAMTPSDKARIRSIFDAMAKAQAEGNPQAAAQSADMFIGKLIVRSGIPTNSTNVQAAGGWLGAKVMCERYAEYFAAN